MSIVVFSSVGVSMPGFMNGIETRVHGARNQGQVSMPGFMNGIET